MDRFFYYLLGAMAAVLIVGLGMMAYNRHAESKAAAAIPPDAPASAPPDLLSAKATPARPWSTPGADLAITTPAPMLLATPTPAPAPTPLPWSPPNVGKTVTIIYPGFTVVYSVTLGTPLAVQYALVQGAKPKRYPEPIKVTTPDSRLIAAAGYVRGEMAFGKSISLYFGPQAGRNTGLMTNVSAMDPATFAGPWAKLSELELRYSGEFKWTEIVAGPILGNPPVGVGKLVVPVAFYRVYRRAYGDTMAFIIPQGATSTKMESYLTNIASVEAATGIAIFANTISVGDRDQVAPAVW